MNAEAVAAPDTLVRDFFKNMDHPSGELLRSIQAGSPSAADELFAKYVPRLQALVRSRLGASMTRRFDSDDVIQSAMRSFFVRAADGTFSASDSGDLWRLLATITMRKLSRATARHCAAKRDARRTTDVDTHGSGGSAFEVREPTPADAAAASEELVWLMRSVDRESRLAIQMRLQGCEFQEIARCLKRSERTVRRWMEEARLLMEERFAALDRGPLHLSGFPGQDDEHPDSTCPALELLDPRGFVLNRLIGAGGVCKVYEATERRIGRKVCIKVLRREFRHRKRYEQRILEEFRLGRALAHPNIVAMHGIGRLPDGGLFLSLDLVEGRSAQEYLQSRTFKPLEAAKIILQVAEAIAHSHRQCIIHCDLTPANVLIDHGEKAWLTDFGFAQRLLREERNDVVRDYIAGTAAYLAPEQFDPRVGPIGIATDVHGLGAILFALLTGRPPYDGRTLEAIERGTSHVVDFGQLQHTPSGIIEVCRRCLEMLPQNRFRDAQCVVDKLMSIEAELSDGKP